MKESLSHTERLFSYGTLQFEGVQLKVFGRRLTGSEDFLSVFSIVPLTIEDESVVAISGKAVHRMIQFTGNPADVIAGTVFDISLKEVLQADGYEVAEVKRIEAVVQSRLIAWVYVDARDSDASAQHQLEKHTKPQTPVHSKWTTLRCFRRLLGRKMIASYD